MKYAVLKVVNGGFSIDSEWSVLPQTITRYHAVCQTLWNAEDVATARVEIIDENLTMVPNYKEYIAHDTETQS